MNEDRYGQVFRESLALEEYKSLRTESADAKRNQQTIFQWSTAAAGVVAVASVAVTRADSASPHANSSGYLAAAMGFIILVPTIVGCAFGAWLGEVQRMERVGRYIRTREEAAMAAEGLSIHSRGAESAMVIRWESIIADSTFQRYYGKNRLGSAAACILFAVQFYASLVTGFALLTTSAAKYQVTRPWYWVLFLLAVLEGVVFLRLAYMAFRLRRSHKVTLAPPPARAAVQYDVVLPCFNESGAIPWIRARIPAAEGIFLVDDRSKDQSARIASANGFTVIRREGRRGVGHASNLAIAQGDSEIVCIFDCDGTFDPTWIPALVEPIEQKKLDLVIGARHPKSEGWTIPHKVLSRLRLALVRLRFPCEVKDMGSARAIRRSVLEEHDIRIRPTTAWSLDLVLQILKHVEPSRVGQVEVPYLRRIGSSKVSGTIWGSLRTIAQSFRVIWCTHIPRNPVRSAVTDTDAGR